MGAIYIDIVNDVKFAWKIQRDVAERGWTEEQVKEDIDKRLPDFAKYVDPQKKDADVILRYEPSDQGLPYLKVKLIQKKDGAFPMISLKKEPSLAGSKPGATIKQYDDDWYGSPVTVVEMDGEIDMEKMSEQGAEIEANLEGLHPIYDEKARANLDLAIYIDIVDDVKFAWKIQRDVAERGWTEEQVKEDIEKRLPDFAKYVDPQKKDADVVLRYEPSDQGLPYLKVKLIQKKGGAFPAISLEKELSLTGSASELTDA